MYQITVRIYESVEETKAQGYLERIRAGKTESLENTGLLTYQPLFAGDLDHSRILEIGVLVCERLAENQGSLW